MAWKNPLLALSREKDGIKRLACKQCGACCPPSCKSFFINAGKANCKQHAATEKQGSARLCENSPEYLYTKNYPSERGHSPDGRAIPNSAGRNGTQERVFSCKACQRLADELFGKGEFNLARDRRVIASPSLHLPVEALLAATNATEFERHKQKLRETLEACGLKSPKATGG